MCSCPGLEKPEEMNGTVLKIILTLFIKVVLQTKENELLNRYKLDLKVEELG